MKRERDLIDQMDQPTPAPRRISKSERTKADLLDAARVIISRDGLFNTRITDIVQFAGRSSGLFYTYFKNKKEIFAALIEQFSVNLARSAPKSTEYANDPAGLVRATVEWLWKEYSNHEADVKGLFETALTEDNIRDEWQKMRKFGIRHFAYRIKQQQDIGLCKGMDPDIAGSALLGLFEFGFFNWKIGNLDFPDRVISDEVAIDTVVAILQNAMQLHPNDAAQGRLG